MCHPVRHTICLAAVLVLVSGVRVDASGAAGGQAKAAGPPHMALPRARQVIRRALRARFGGAFRAGRGKHIGGNYRSRGAGCTTSYRAR